MGVIGFQLHRFAYFHQGFFVSFHGVQHGSGAEMVAGSVGLPFYQAIDHIQSGVVLPVDEERDKFGIQRGGIICVHGPRRPGGCGLDGLAAGFVRRSGHQAAYAVH